jgi:hypothetical protein
VLTARVENRSDHRRGCHELDAAAEAAGFPDHLAPLSKLRAAQRTLAAATATEAIERALDLAVVQSEATVFISADLEHVVRNHARETLACDFFVAVTATFRLVYVFLVLEIGTRRISSRPELRQRFSLRHELQRHFFGRSSAGLRSKKSNGLIST